MITPPSKHIADIFIANGYPFDQSQWSVWIGKQPDKPDRCVTIYDTGGLDPNPKWALNYPSIQVRVRGDINDYLLVYTKAQQLRNLTVGKDSYTASNGDLICSITGIGDIMSMGRDENNRPEIVFNLRMIIEENLAGQTTDREQIQI
jgi:hypothetical protein